MSETPQNRPPILAIDWQAMGDVMSDALFDCGLFEGTEEEQIEQASAVADDVIEEIRKRVIEDVQRMEP